MVRSWETRYIFTDQLSSVAVEVHSTEVRSKLPDMSPQHHAKVVSFLQYSFLFYQQTQNAMSFGGLAHFSRKSNFLDHKSRHTSSEKFIYTPSVLKNWWVLNYKGTKYLHFCVELWSYTLVLFIVKSSEKIKVKGNIIWLLQLLPVI